MFVIKRSEGHGGTIWFHGREKHYGCDIYFENVDGEASRRQEGSYNVFEELAKAYGGGAERGVVVLDEE